MWIKIGAMSRHHSPWAISALAFTPNARRVGSFVLPPANDIRRKMAMLNARKMYVKIGRRLHTACRKSRWSSEIISADADVIRRFPANHAAACGRSLPRPDGLYPAHRV